MRRDWNHGVLHGDTGHQELEQVGGPLKGSAFTLYLAVPSSATGETLRPEKSSRT